MGRAKPFCQSISTTAIAGLVLGYAGIALWVIVILATVLIIRMRH